MPRGFCRVIERTYSTIGLARLVASVVGLTFLDELNITVNLLLPAALHIFFRLPLGKRLGVCLKCSTSVTSRFVPELEPGSIF